MILSALAGKAKADVESALAAMQAAERCDSLVCVGAPAKGGGDMCKVHVHTNAPGDIFDAVNAFTSEAVPIKEKVEDMYSERDATGLSYFRERFATDGPMTVNDMDR